MHPIIASGIDPKAGKDATREWVLQTLDFVLSMTANPLEALADSSRSRSRDEAILALLAGAIARTREPALCHAFG